MTEDVVLSSAICVYLRYYPGWNDDQFRDVFGDQAERVLKRVREILTETIKIDLDWTGMTLSCGGCAVQAIMAERHPELSVEALTALRRFYTFLMR